VAFLYRDRATLDRFSAECGGGKVAVSGFVGFGSPFTYYLQAHAEQVRYRDPTGASVTANAALNLTGTSERSVLGGEALITRINFNPQTDLGSLLAATAQPAPPPSRPGMFTQGIRFDVRVRTAPQARLETALTRGLQAEADLRLRGDPARPAVLGRVTVSQGEVLFFGNRYTIDSGEIDFVNPARIEPVVKLDLQTKVRSVDVTLTLSGPITKMNVTYRSDPPLQLADIVGLLATGREPASAPGLVGARTAQSQSWEQAGASALMGQAIASPLAGRLQRFFGVSRLKIDPTISGTTGTPEARVTLEQQLSPTLTFTYITNLTRAEQQTMRVEWGLTKDWSVVGLREENGLFGVDFLYRKRFK
jgi:translocation and assembly module TamB